MVVVAVAAMEVVVATEVEVVEDLAVGHLLLLRMKPGTKTIIAVVACRTSVR